MKKLDALLRSPWMLRSDWLGLIGYRIARSLADGDPEGTDQEPPEPKELIVQGNVAVLPIDGLILQHPGLYDDGTWPVTYTEWWGEAFDQLVADPEVGAIFSPIDSPGGISYGTAELSQKIHDARGTKPLVAVANSMAASAAYYIGSAFEKVYVTPGGDVGSIGVYTMHMDISKALEDFGIKVTLISAGEFKVEGNPFEPLGEEAQEELQRQVDESYDQFVDDVGRNRGVSQDEVLERFGRGRVLSAERALAAGMVDGVRAADEVLSELVAASARTAAAVGMDLEDDEPEPRGDLPVGCEVRSLGEVSAPEPAPNHEGLILEGVSIRYGVPSTHRARQPDGRVSREMFAEGAFSKSVASDDILIIYQHNPERVFGRRRSAGDTGPSTADVWEQGGAVCYRVDRIADVPWTREALSAIERGDVDRNSFAFLREEWHYETVEGESIAVIDQARLLEMGPNSLPTNHETSAIVRRADARRAAAQDAAILRRQTEMEATV